MRHRTIEKDNLLLDGGKLLRYALSPAGEKLPSLVVCLHPGWVGPTPPPNYGDQFMDSIWLPAFAHTGAVIAAPTCPNGSWNNPESIAALLELLEHLVSWHRVNSAQVSLVGYSAGGWGAWYLLAEQAYRFASAIMYATLPVIDAVNHFEDNFARCADLIPGRLEEWAGLLPLLPITMIHSREDELFPFAKAELVYQILQKAGRPVRFIPVEGVGHFDGGEYVGALRDSFHWLAETWGVEQ